MTTQRKATAAEKRLFHKNYESLLTRAICDGREVDVDGLDGSALEPFCSLGWMSFIIGQGPIHDKMIREFYASYSFTSHNNSIQFYLNNSLYQMTLELFGTHLGVPTTGHQFYSAGKALTNLPHFISPEVLCDTLCDTQNLGHNVTRNGIRAKDLVYPHNVRYKIIDWNVYCRDGNRSEVQASEAALLWCLHHKEPVNLAYFVAMRMCGLITNGTRSLPYGILLNNLFDSLEIRSGPSRALLHQPINIHTLSRMNPSKSKGKRPRRSVDRDEEEEAYDLIDTYGVGGSNTGSRAGRSEADVEESVMPPEIFSALPADQQMTTLYNQQLGLRGEQREIRKELSGIKKLLNEIKKTLTCRRSPSPDS